MSQLDDRIKKCEFRIKKNMDKVNKLLVKIEKRKSLLENDAFSDEGEKLWAKYELDDWVKEVKQTEKAIAFDTEKMNGYRLKKKEAKKLEKEIPSVKAVEDFLCAWRERAFDFFINEVKTFFETRDGFDKSMKTSEKIQALSRRFSNDIFNYASYSHEGFIEKLNVDLDREVIRKRIDLYNRCMKVVGKITDASGLYGAPDGSINGYVVGEKGTASVRTVDAGGYNIQVYHYRVLVKKLNS